MSIQRYVGIEVHEADDGDMITYEDHVKSINMTAMKAYQYLALSGNKDAADKISQIILEAAR